MLNLKMDESKITRIDLFGALAVGKSTIYSSLLSQHKNSLGVVDSNEIIRNIYKKTALQHTASFKSYLLSIPLLLNYPKKHIIPICNMIIPYRLERNLMMERSTYWETFLSACMHGAHNNTKDIIKKMTGVVSILGRASRVNLLYHSEANYTVIFDESLSMGIYDIVDSRSGFCKETIDNYFNTMPAPDMLIYFKNNSEQVFENKINRFKKRAMYSYAYNTKTKRELYEMTLAECSIAEYSIDVLNNRGVKIIEIDTSHSIRSNVKKIVNSIQQLEKQ